ncbi:MAG TPA: helix-turn-helix domain-containing protein [Gemmatimonadales bacterium]|nr:helix-turn-helix domain-containing protein [Gemmatimonadales bacterium]
MKHKLNNIRALRIIDSAQREFARRGYEGARMEQIARSAGVNKQLLFYYFQSKRGLFQAVLGRAAAELEQSLAALAAPSGRSLDRLERTLDGLYGFFAGHPDLVSLLTRSGKVDVAPFAPVVKRLVVLLAEGQGLGQVRDDVDPHLTAAQALVLMVGFLNLESMVSASAPSLAMDEPALRQRWREDATRLLVAGVAAR